MINPSGIRHWENEELRVNEVRRGLYTITNAYVGNYEYFKDRPILTKGNSSEQSSEEHDYECGDSLK